MWRAIDNKIRKNSWTTKSEFKRIVFPILLFLFVFSGNVKSQIIFHEGTFSQICDEARAAGKPVFVEASTSWCSVCRLMEKNVFSDTAVANYFNKNFYCWKADMGKPENAAFAETNSIHAYPTLLFFDNNSKLIFSELGYKDKTKLIGLGEKAMDEKSFTANTASLRIAFESHTTDKNLLFRYYTLLTENGRNADAVGDAAIALMEPEDLKNDTAFNIWFERDQRMESPLLDYFLANQDWFSCEFPRMTYQKPHYILSYNIEMARLAQDEKLLSKTFVFIRRMYTGEEQTLMLHAAEMKYSKC
ncbi:hypothetical protein BH09BAC5_BH09BAC5_09490 [soil metagenome]